MGVTPQTEFQTIYVLFSLCKHTDIISKERLKRAMSHLNTQLQTSAFNNAVKKECNVFQSTQHGAPLCPHHSDRLGRYVQLCLAG